MVLALLNQQNVTKAQWQGLFTLVYSICSWITDGRQRVHRELHHEISSYILAADQATSLPPFLIEIQRIRRHSEEQALLRAYIAEWRVFHAQTHFLPMPFYILDQMTSSTQTHSRNVLARVALEQNNIVRSVSGDRGRASKRA